MQISQKEDMMHKVKCYNIHRNKNKKKKQKAQDETEK